MLQCSRLIIIPTSRIYNTYVFCLFSLITGSGRDGLYSFVLTFKFIPCCQTVPNIFIGINQVFFVVVCCQGFFCSHAKKFNSDFFKLGLKEKNIHFILFLFCLVLFIEFQSFQGFCIFLSCHYLCFLWDWICFKTLTEEQQKLLLV